MTDTECLAIITGATGITGRHCLKEILHSCPKWQVITFSRRSLEFAPFEKTSQHDQEKRIFQAHANLLEKNEVENILKETLGKVQQYKEDKKDGSTAVRIYHCAYLESGQGAVEDCKLNLTMLKNVVEAVENAKNVVLKHVFTMEGCKWYGQQFLQPLKTPFNESDGRHIGPNFYYDLEDYLRSRTGTAENTSSSRTNTKDTTPTTTYKASWTWSGLRPNPVIGFSTGSYMSLLPTIAVYGSLCKELGLQMRFPGSYAAYTAPMEVCNADVLAEAMVFLSTTPAAENQAYNINNGDYFRWEQVWPRLADWFGCKPGEPLKVGDLTEVIGEYKDVWEGLVQKHELQVSFRKKISAINSIFRLQFLIICLSSLHSCYMSLFPLQDIPYEKLATWKFMGFVFSMPESGWFSNTLKLRKAGFHGMVVDTGDSMIEMLETMRQHKIIP
jgi:nucleoside-diphosphate-sugar epimerase